MAHGDIVASNVLLEDRAKKLLEYLSANTTLRLYSNNLNPTPKNAIGDFTEATFAGYARRSMTGQWSEVRKEEEGKYTFTSKNIVWTGAVGAIGIVVGWMLVTNAKVIFSARLPVTWDAAPGKKVEVRVNIVTSAASIGCCVKCGG